jgi:hypothetical protein
VSLVHELEILAAQNGVASFDGRRPAAIVNAQVLDHPRWAHLR